MANKPFNILTNSLRRIPANSLDWALSSSLSDSRKRDFRNGFNIPYNEEIVYVRDTSFWNSANQGIVLTDCGLHFCWDNDDPENNSGFLAWQYISNAEYREDCVCFLYGEELCQGNLDSFVKESDSKLRAKYGRCIATAINEVSQYFAQEQEAQAESDDKVYYEFAEKFDALRNENKEEEAAEVAYSYYDQYKNGNMLLFALTADPNPHRSLEVVQREFDDWRENDYMRHTLFAFYSEFLAKTGDLKLGRAKLLETYNTTPKELEWIGINLRTNALDDFHSVNQAYVEGFFEMPYQERKLLFVTDGYTTLDQENIAVLHLKDVGAMSFPMGHPIANQLYVAHPLVQQHYIPFENYEIELIKDRVHEFCSVMECLGATSISIEYNQTSDSDQQRNMNSSHKGNANVKVYSGKGSINQQETNKFMQSIGQQLNLHQTYQPYKAPYLPDNLVWYEQEPTWQRLAEQRMRGSLTAHTESIETSRTQVIQNESLTEIEAELKALLASANLQISKTTSEKLEQHDNVVLRVHVEFAPLSSLGQAQYVEIASVPNGETKSLSEDEAEYVEMLQEALAEGGGQLNSSVRKFLQKFASRRGISSQRAQELENSCSPALTPEEQKYLEEVRSVVAEEGGLSPISVRLLQKYAASLGISAQRAEELNQLAR